MANQPIVLLVGHCSADARRLTRAVLDAVPGAKVEAVGDARVLDSKLPTARLALVNRVPHGNFGDRGGLALVAHAVGAKGPAVMLVSNLERAQAQAEQLGAMPGFGKSDLDHDTTIALLRSAIVGP